MYIELVDIKEHIPFPKASVITVLGKGEFDFDFLKNEYKIIRQIQDDTRFVIVEQNGDFTLNLFSVTNLSVPYCVVGARPENALILDVLWHKTNPFIARIKNPLFMVKIGKERAEDVNFCVRLIFALAEKLTQEILSGKESNTSDIDNFSFSLLDTNIDKILTHLQSVKGRVDGLKQAENALLLLKIKEKRIFNSSDCLVLLAKYLAKVYNCFISDIPLSLFAPDNGQRIEILQEFFGIEKPSVRSVLSEYEIRKKYYLIQQNKEILERLWGKVCLVIEEGFNLIRPLTTDNGFCLEEHSEDIKFATFLSPDILSGETLLSFIKDCGIGDSFI